MKRRRLGWAVGLALLAGCGYSAKPMTPPNVRTVYVPIFDNRTFRRGLEFELTKAVKDQLLFRSDLRLARKEYADTELLGEIVDVDENVLTEDLRDDIVETGVTVTVHIIWKDLRTNRILLERKNLSETARFIVTRGENKGAATKEAFHDLAERIVELLVDPW